MTKQVVPREINNIIPVRLLILGKEIRNYELSLYTSWGLLLVTGIHVRPLNALFAASMASNYHSNVCEAGLCKSLMIIE